MGGFKLFALVAAVVALIGGWMALFTVDMREQALILQFGEFKRQVTQPGLYARIPFVQEVRRFDRRLLDFDAPAEEVIASDQKRMVVDAFARYLIVEPLKYYQTVGDERMLRPRLAAIINSNIRRVLGQVPLQSAISADRSELMRQITGSTREEAAAFGIEVADVRIKRADLPTANSEAVFRRMQTEREQEAAELRAKGNQESLTIRAEADRERVVIMADAERDSQILRGEGEATSNRIFAEAFGRDPDFFAFYRTMQAYQEIGGAGATMVMSPESDFYRYFVDTRGGESPARRAADMETSGETGGTP